MKKDSKVISIRIDSELLEMLKKVARKESFLTNKNITYAYLMKEMILEKYSDEFHQI